MKITVNFFTLVNVIYAIICSAFLPENSLPQYYRSALISLVIMIFILLSRFIYILTNNSDVNKKRSEINNIILFLMYFFTGLFELNVRFGYGDTIGISGEEEKTGTLYTLGLSYIHCILLNIFVFILTWLILILKIKYTLNCKQILKNKVILLLVALGVFVTVKSVIYVLFDINNYNTYVDIATAHHIYWVVYFISIPIYKILSDKARK